MKVVREALEGTVIQRLVVVAPEESGHHVGEVIGYRCPDCAQADESLQQIWHEAECPLAGAHGRRHYDDLKPDVAGRTVPELDPDHPITMVRAAETDDPQGVHNGEVLKFLCDDCKNGDEDLFEIVHDEACGLAGGSGDQLTNRDQRKVATPDGGLPGGG